MQTKREYLVGLGLAKPGRGKFSVAAHAALEKAMKEGMEFKEIVPTPPARSEVRAKQATPVQPKIDPKSYDPAKVRAWAGEKGITVGDRGRIPAALVADYLADVKDAPKRAEQDGFGESAPRRFFDDLYEAQGLTIKKTWRDVCNVCRYSIGFCRCIDGPRAFADDNATLVPLVPVKGK